MDVSRLLLAMAWSHAPESAGPRTWFVLVLDEVRSSNEDPAGASLEGTSADGRCVIYGAWLRHR